MLEDLSEWVGVGQALACIVKLFTLRPQLPLTYFVVQLLNFRTNFP